MAPHYSERFAEDVEVMLTCLQTVVTCALLCTALYWQEAVAPFFFSFFFLTLTQVACCVSGAPALSFAWHKLMSAVHS